MVVLTGGVAACPRRPTFGRKRPKPRPKKNVSEKKRKKRLSATKPRLRANMLMYVSWLYGVVVAVVVPLFFFWEVCFNRLRLHVV